MKYQGVHTFLDLRLSCLNVCGHLHSFWIHHWQFLELTKEVAQFIGEKRSIGKWCGVGMASWGCFGGPWGIPQGTFRGSIASSCGEEMRDREHVIGRGRAWI